MELSAAESRLVAETLADAGDALIRKAVSAQSGGGLVFDELMIAGQGAAGVWKPPRSVTLC